MGGAQSMSISPLPTGKTVIITGGNTGIGYETAKSIAFMGAKVILAVRTEERGKSVSKSIPLHFPSIGSCDWSKFKARADDNWDAIAKMDAEFQETKKTQTYGITHRDKLDIQYKVCDLSSLKSTMDFINWFKSTELKIHVLICNACTYSLQEAKTEDSWEATYQVNYLSHFLMVAHFLPIMCQSGDDCRIILISSETHKDADFDAEYASTSKMGKYDGYQSYANCKLFQIMHMYSLDRVLEKHPTVDVLSTHRGKLDALVFPNDPHSNQGFSCKLCCLKCCGFITHLKMYVPLGLPLVLVIGKLTDDSNGAETAIYAALDSNLKGLSRGYFLRPKDKPRWPSRTARNKELQDYLWKSTIDNLADYMTPEVLKLLKEL